MQKLGLIFFILLILQTAAMAQTITQDEDPAAAPVDYAARAFEPSDFNKYPWLKEFKNVIVINKADSGSDKQSMRLFVDGKLKEFTRISTGRETFEKGCGPGQKPKRDHCSHRPYWSTTPVGYFTVNELVENYFSNLWETWMPYAIFFQDGIATHQAPAGTEAKLGQRASGGCVRSHPSVAPKMFAHVKNAGKGLVPKFNRAGEVKKTAEGDVIRWQGYKTLVIVHNVVK